MLFDRHCPLAKAFGLGFRSREAQGGPQVARGWCCALQSLGDFFLVVTLPMPFYRLFLQFLQGLFMFWMICSSFFLANPSSCWVFMFV